MVYSIICKMVRFFSSPLALPRLSSIGSLHVAHSSNFTPFSAGSRTSIWSRQHSQNVWPQAICRGVNCGAEPYGSKQIGHSNAAVTRATTAAEGGGDGGVNLFCGVNLFSGLMASDGVGAVNGVLAVYFPVLPAMASRHQQTASRQQQQAAIWTCSGSSCCHSERAPEWRHIEQRPTRPDKPLVVQYMSQ